MCWEGTPPRRSGQRALPSAWCFLSRRRQLSRCSGTNTWAMGDVGTFFRAARTSRDLSPAPLQNFSFLFVYYAKGMKVKIQTNTPQKTLSSQSTFVRANMSYHFHWVDTKVLRLQGRACPVLNTRQHFQPRGSGPRTGVWDAFSGAALVFVRKGKK